MRNRITVLHLRTSSGPGGGPDKTILTTGGLIDRNQFDYAVAYLRRRGREIAPTLDNARRAGLECREFPGGAFFDPLQMIRLVRFIRSRGVTILHCHDPKSDLYGAALRPLLPSVHLVTTLHGWLPGARKRFSNRMDLWALRRFDCILAVSRHTEAIARRHGIGNTRVVYNAIDTDEWRPVAEGSVASPVRKKDPGAILVGYVGRLRAEKGPLDFVRVAALIRERSPRCEFAVAGDGPQREEMAALAHELGVAEHFHFLGHVGGDALRSLYQSLGVLLSPSLTEGLPNNVLEACAMGVPVVATDVGGVGEIIAHGENGLLAQAGDVATLAEHVLAVASDQETGRRLAAKAREVVEERFSMTARTRQIEEIYAELVR
ncbi:MAG TPA: glycosyltransferase family 4 protein [Sumerlaeia bacterium]|nr:glycosyltransferase family 4 protein [Sumerlaeia bacterium]